MKKDKLFQWSIINSVGVLIYVFILALFATYTENVFGAHSNNVAQPIVMLLLFVFSALITSFLILGRPVMLYAAGHKKEGLKLLGYTAMMLLVIIVMELAVYILTK